ncbi:hypothetical protein ABLO27_17660 [Roseibium sp. SCPC15]|uniref:hypothetical protein n=1 Tax=Roseibium sp. SCP15 TaxID=3141376 RepID=UPI0033379060
MIFMKLMKTGCVAIGLLAAGVPGVESSESEDVRLCPNDREWGSTLDPQTRPMFFYMGERNLNRVLAESNRAAFEDDELMRVSWLLTVHTFQRHEYVAYLRDFFMALSSSKAIQDRFSEEILSELSECILEETDEDCANMAYRKGYIPSFGSLAKHEYLSRSIQLFLDWCERTGSNELTER